MSNLNRLACVIPYYEGQGTIARALNSALNSAHCDEVILVSDASPNPVRHALHPDHLDCERSGRLKILELSVNLGQGSARNLGAALARAECLSFLDQDDELLPEFHVHALATLDRFPHAAAVQVDAEVLRDARVLIDQGDPRYRMILESVPWNVVIRRAAFWTCGGFPTGSDFRKEAAGEDIAFKTALRACFSVRSISTIGVRHHVREGSATDRFLRRTSVGLDGSVLFHHRYPEELDGSLARALQTHVNRALQNRRIAVNLAAPTP